MGDLTQNFSLREFRCKCGCGNVIVEPSLVNLLQTIRNNIRRPIYILSGYRCKGHNRQIGGAENSFHTQGKAADIAWEGRELKVLYLYCEEQNPNGLGVYPERGCIHIDVGHRVQRWIYREGKYYYAFD